MSSRLGYVLAGLCVLFAAIFWVVADAWPFALILLGCAVVNGFMANENRKAGR